jgi:hypothetical protein
MNPPGVSGAQFAQACSAYAAAVCNKLAGCEQSRMVADYGDMGTCTSRRTAQCMAAAVAPGAMLTPPMLDACSTALQAANCDAYLYNAVAACVLKGRRGDGGGCADSWQCSSGLCKRGRGLNCGSCAPFAAAGTACGEGDCGPNLECADSGVCATPSAVGGPCGNAQPCRAGGFCRGNACAAQIEMMGAACMGAASCSGQKGLVCVQQQCAAVPFAQAGQACGGQGPASVFCQGSSECTLAGQAQQNMGTCSMVVRDGEGCGDGKSCLAPADCISGICQIPRGAECN